MGTGFPPGQGNSVTEGTAVLGRKILSHRLSFDQIFVIEAGKRRDPRQDQRADNTAQTYGKIVQTEIVQQFNLRQYHNRKGDRYC